LVDTPHRVQRHRPHRDPYGLIAWDQRRHTGLAVYGADGALRFPALFGKTVRSVQADGGYAYVRTGSGRFSLDLRTGRTTGPLTSRALLILPSLNGPLPYLH
jgi:hypothetical protein